MRWLQTEYLLKGVYLGLLLFIALQAENLAAIGLAMLFILGGLAVCLGVAAVLKLRQGYRVRGQPITFTLFLLLESPHLVYTGILLGAALGALSTEQKTGAVTDLTYCAAGGLVLGVICGQLRDVKDRRLRLGLCLLLAGVLVAAVLYWFGPFEEFRSPNAPKKTLTFLFGLQLLLGLPFFYLLTLAGKEEETEVEIGVMCAVLGLALAIMIGDKTQIQGISILVPVVLYFLYTWYVLRGLRAFKHALRGDSYAKLGRYRQALLSFRRAVQLDPTNQMAREGLWRVHRSINLSELANDPETMALIDFDLCLERAGTLLQEKPTPEKSEEASRLLELVLAQRPNMAPRAGYWRCVAALHQRDYDRAAAELEAVLDSSRWAPSDAQRLCVLYPAWRLALLDHREMERRVGLPQLVQPGRRMEAIAAVERHLAERADDTGAQKLKIQLYRDLTEADYDQAAVPGKSAAHFDHEFVRQLGLALINDPERWPRGGEYLRLAARGLPHLGPTLYVQIAQANQRAGREEAALHDYELAKRAGQAVGPANLTGEDRQAYFETIKLLGESARARGDVLAAIDNYRLFLESERSGKETLRILADLYEKKPDPLAALWFTEQGLVYDSKDKDFLRRKDVYYNSVTPEELKARLELVRNGFDVAYCLRTARKALDARNADFDTIDWGERLCQLTLVVVPESVTGKVLLAQAKLRRGEREEAVALLEAVHSPKPEKFASGEDEESWYVCCKLLGRLYLEELGRPDLAVTCFTEFRQSSKSGADTIYRLGQAYEQLGDRARAARCYENVTAYEGHPLAHEASDALYRLKTG